MPRTLFLHDQQPSLQTQRAIYALTSGSYRDNIIRTLGAGGDFLNSFSAAWSLRGLARECDFVHVFGDRALVPAAFAPFRRIIYTPTQAPTRRHLCFLRAVAHYRDLHLICPTITLHRTLVTAGLSPERCHLIRPGVNFGRINPRRDSIIRKALGFDDSHDVLLLPGESTSGANHEQATWAAGILNVLDHRTRVLIWGRGPRAAAALNFGRRMNQPELVTCAEERLGRPVDFEELLSAVDAAVVAATGPVDTLAIAQCMAAALPIVATVTPTVAELLEDRHTALMCAPNVPRLLAGRILDLRADKELRRKLTDTARSEAYEFFPQTKFVAEHQAMYARVAE